jgi:hypothetical protein
MHKALSLIFCGIVLAGCEQLGLDEPAKAAAAKEAEGRAIGSACRHSGRSLEDCYALNKKAAKAAIFTGWRDMDAYMRENNIQIIPPGEATAKPATTDKPSESPVPTGGGNANPAGKQSSMNGKPLPAMSGRMV